jgi:hypothetical protein
LEIGVVLGLRERLLDQVAEMTSFTRIHFNVVHAPIVKTDKRSPEIVPINRDRGISLRLSRHTRHTVCPMSRMCGKMLVFAGHVERRIPGVQNTAIGLKKEPVPPGKRSGAATARNSQRCSSSHTAETSSRFKLSAQIIPMAAICSAWIG